MTLEFKICPACHTEHALMRNGEMSIHSNASGVRCAGSGDPHEYKRRLAQETGPRPTRSQRSKQRKRERTAATERNAILRREAERDPERQAAYDLAAERAHRRYGIKPKSANPDRIIYVVKGAHTVSGGLPGTNRRH